MIIRITIYVPSSKVHTIIHIAIYVSSSTVHTIIHIAIYVSSSTVHTIIHIAIYVSSSTVHRPYTSQYTYLVQRSIRSYTSQYTYQFRCASCFNLSCSDTSDLATCYKAFLGYNTNILKYRLLFILFVFVSDYNEMHSFLKKSYWSLNVCSLWSLYGADDLQNYQQFKDPRAT